MSKAQALLSATVGTSLLFATLLAAQRPGGPAGPGGRGFPSPLLAAMDTNHDGKLSADEIASAPRTLLKADKNGDGSITPDELQPPPEAAIASPDDLTEQLMAFDKNGDGVLTPDELPARMQSLFVRADTNHDGKLTREELHALAARQTLPTGSQRQSSNDPLFLALDLNHDAVISPDEIAAAATSLLTLDNDHDGELSASEMRPPQQTPAQMADHMLAENDIDKDGKISRAEAPDFLKGQFDTIDKNQDGFLDHDELTAFFAAQAGGRGGQGRGPGRGPGQGERPILPPNPDETH